MLINKETVTVQVHPGLFHEDDILCIALLMNKYGKDSVSIIRDTRIHPEADFVLDVGQENYIEYRAGQEIKKATLNEFEEIYSDSVEIISVHLDHHPVSEKDRNYRADDPYQVHNIETIKDKSGDNIVDTGILHCGASLLYDFIHEYDNQTNETEYQDFKDIIIKPVAAKDNGMRDLISADLLSYVASYNPTWEETYSDDTVKDIAVMVMNHIQTPIESLKNEYSRAEKSAKRKDIIKDAQSRGEIKVREAMSRRGDAPYIVLSNGALSKDAKEAAIDENEFLKERNGLLKIKDLICFEIHEDTARNQYVMVCIPPDKEHQMEQLITIPEDVLENKNCTFRHRTGFMAAFKTLDAAKKTAEELYSKQLELYKNHELTIEEKETLLFAMLSKEGISKDDFDSYRMREIRFGLSIGLTPEQVKLYANPKYSKEQTGQIRLGLEHGIDASVYTILNSEGKPVFDADQMQQIRQGLEAGVDVSIYTILDSEGKPAFKWEQMQQIRFGLEKGLDTNVYAKKEFSWEQMGQIRRGLEKGPDANVYAKKEFNAHQMGQIRRGIEKGVDVSVYTILNSEGKPAFDWEQMKQIRKGLEKGTDVSVYIILNSEEKPVFSGSQMLQIRLGLEAGLPKEIVKQEIAKPDFSVEEMTERRENLDEELYELGKEGLLEKYGIAPEKENSEVEKDKNILNASEEISL